MRGIISEIKFEKWKCDIAGKFAIERNFAMKERIYRAHRQSDGFLFRGNSRTWSSNTGIEAKIRENREVARLRIIESYRILTDVGSIQK